MWRTRLLLDKGEVRLTVRAWDTTAATQPESESVEQVWNPKGYVNNAWGQVREACAELRSGPGAPHLRSNSEELHRN